MNSSFTEFSAVIALYQTKLWLISYYKRLEGLKNHEQTKITCTSLTSKIDTQRERVRGEREKSKEIEKEI